MKISNLSWLLKYIYFLYFCRIVLIFLLFSKLVQEKRLSHKDKSRYALQQRALTSKFLHYSIAESDAGSESEYESQSNISSKPKDDDSSVPMVCDKRYTHFLY